MATRLLTAQPVLEARQPALQALIQTYATPPGLAIVMVGHHPPSMTYVRKKQDMASTLGCNFYLSHLHANITQAALHATLHELAATPHIHGIILQLPLPDHLDATAALNQIPPHKDVDGLTDASQQKQEAGDPHVFWPATPLGVMTLLDFYHIPVSGKNVCVIGRSRLVGAPLALMLQHRGAHVDIFSLERPMDAHIMQQADVICTATGQPGLLTPAMVSPQATVIDIGITRQQTADGKSQLVGDAAPDLLGHVAALTPVPGGVGPLTVLSLLENVVKAV